ncbi:MAG TPA: NAD(P)-dependent oxidoreductase [Phycisphaerae bacterium]
MRVAVTGATGFIGRYIVNQLLAEGCSVKAWYRSSSDRGGFARPLPDGRGSEQGALEWVEGELGDARARRALVDGVDAVVHAALHHDRGRFRGGEGELLDFVRLNVLGTIALIEAARAAGVARFVFLSTCAVHELVLEDRPLDEAHPLWPSSHYGAHKAAIEKFIHSYGIGKGYDICALRPTGVYGLARPIERSKWYSLVQAVSAGEPIANDRGGKEVHVTDVAKAVSILLRADGIAGQAYNCYDRYIADQDVAEIAKRLSGSPSVIQRLNAGPKHQIVTDKIRALGVTFGGALLLEATVRQLLATAPR